MPGQMGVLRIACGARLIADEPSHVGLTSAERLGRKFADVRIGFYKIALTLQNWDALAAADPQPRLRNRALRPSAYSC